jgi:catalase
MVYLRNLNYMLNAPLKELATQAQEGQKSSPADLVKALHSAFGNHHARAVHSKGIILEGFFTPSKEAASLTKAVHLQDATSQVVVRFSDFTGIPDIPDTNPLSHPRGMSIKFKLPNDASTDLVTHSFNGFPAATSDQFRELLLAVATSGPDAPKPTALDKFLETHPVARTFLTTQKPASVSYATLSYFGVNAFEFTNQEGKTCLIRYQIIPEAGEEFLSKEQLANAAPDYLQKEIVGRVAKGPLKFKMQAQIAREGDDPKNPSVAWPDNRRVVALGTITIDKLASNTVVEDKALAFIPNNLPAGITPADPMIDFRSKAYPISVAERQ